MRVLILKTSSLGDVIHTMPAITDAANALPGITFDWVVEENFAEIPRWHPAVRNVISVALRRWKKKPFSKRTWAEWYTARQQIKANQYDLIIDAQGLLKSAFFACFAKGKRCGFDRHSVREPLAALFYQKGFAAHKNQHAIARLRSLFSQALNYPLTETVPDYGVDRSQFFIRESNVPYLVFLHGTTWETKHWPEEYWIALAKFASAKKLQIKLPWGNEQEKARANRIAAVASNIEVLPRLSLIEMASVLANAKAIVAVDTGLGHLSAALDVPTISLYGPTNAVLTGALGKNQIHLSAQFQCAPCLSRQCTYAEPSSTKPPCFSTVPPFLVWRTLEERL